MSAESREKDPKSKKQTAPDSTHWANKEGLNGLYGQELWTIFPLKERQAPISTDESQQKPSTGKPEASTITAPGKR